MIKIRAKLKKYGNSYRIIFPKEFIIKEKLKENDEVIVNINPVSL